MSSSGRPGRHVSGTRLFRLGMLFAVALLLGCGQRRVGELTARDHAYAGRPREALSTLSAEHTSAQNALLNRAALLHASGEYAQSEQLFAA